MTGTVGKVGWSMIEEAEKSRQIPEVLKRQN